MKCTGEIVIAGSGIVVGIWGIMDHTTDRIDDGSDEISGIPKLSPELKTD